MRLILLLVSSTLLYLSAAATGQHASERQIKALFTSDRISIDGHLNEKVWRQADVATGFFLAHQKRGITAKLKTEAMVVYDAENLYVGFRCFEPNMRQLRTTFTRRDSNVWQDDAVEVLLDTYHDKRNCYVFCVNTIGTQLDQRIGNEGSTWDRNWDGEWEAKIQKNSDNWTAEFAIPFKILRFIGMQVSEHNMSKTGCWVNPITPTTTQFGGVVKKVLDAMSLLKRFRKVFVPMRRVLKRMLFAK